MANAPSPCPRSSPSPRRWCSTKRWILAALALIVILAAIASVVTFVFRPGTIIFSITNASKKEMKTPSGTPLAMQLNLTLVANNTSLRAGVQHLGSIVLLELATLPPGSTNYTTVTLPVEPWSWQPPGGTSCMNVSALMSIDNYNSYFPDAATSGRRNMDGKAGAPNQIRVLVVTEVHFKIRGAYLWLHIIRVLCGPVNHFKFNGSLGANKISCTKV